MLLLCLTAHMRVQQTSWRAPRCGRWSSPQVTIGRQRRPLTLVLLILEYLSASSTYPGTTFHAGLLTIAILVTISRVQR